MNTKLGFLSMELAYICIAVCLVIFIIYFTIFVVREVLGMKNSIWVTQICGLTIIGFLFFVVLVYIFGNSKAAFSVLIILFITWGSLCFFILAPVSDEKQEVEKFVNYK